jgi:hypothetical protein
MALWRFDEGAASTLTDSSANGWTATITSGAFWVNDCPR